MSSPRARPVTVLVYDADAAERYAKLITPSPRVSLRVCATRDEALGAIGEAEVVFGWKVPPEVWRGARRLRWLQVMGAGVEWALVPTLPRRVIITRAPGLFGPWMVEYALGWCRSLTGCMPSSRRNMG